MGASIPTAGRREPGQENRCPIGPSATFSGMRTKLRLFALAGVATVFLSACQCTPMKL
jgi:hypothetical protein